MIPEAIFPQAPATDRAKKSRVNRVGKTFLLLIGTPSVCDEKKIEQKGLFQSFNKPDGPERSRRNLIYGFLKTETLRRVESERKEGNAPAICPPDPGWLLAAQSVRKVKVSNHTCWCIGGVRWGCLVYSRHYTEKFQFRQFGKLSGAGLRIILLTWQLVIATQSMRFNH